MARRRRNSTRRRKPASRAAAKRSFPILPVGIAAVAALGAYIFWSRSANAAPAPDLTAIGGGTGSTSGSTNIVRVSSATPDPQVRAAQQALIAKGYNVGSTGADGILGTNTRQAITRFQADNGLPQTGVLNDATRTALAGGSGAAADLGYTPVEQAPAAPSGTYTGLTSGNSPGFPGCTVVLRSSTFLRSTPDEINATAMFHEFFDGEHVILTGGKQGVMYEVLIPRTNESGWMNLGSAELLQCPGA